MLKQAQLTNWFEATAYDVKRVILDWIYKKGVPMSLDYVSWLSMLDVEMRHGGKMKFGWVEIGIDLIKGVQLFLLSNE